jgi:RimJ/RimL family protein N-acetyltransferase
MSPAFMQASLDGDLARAAALIGAALPPDWPGATGRTMRLRLRQLATDPASQPWLLRAMVLRAPERTVVGHIGFHAPPDPRGAVEVGYTVLPEYRRRGLAFEAVQALFAWAGREHGVQQFIASVSPTNQPSLNLVRKLGFQQTGAQWDEEDGEELVFELKRAC